MVRIQAPFEGSDIADWVTKRCEFPSFFSCLASIFYQFCQGTKSLPAFDSLQGAAKKWYKWNTLLSKHVSGALCGTSPSGLTTTVDRATNVGIYNFLATESEHDGLVPLRSCKKVNTFPTFADRYSSKYYEASINHSDGTCRNGDGWIGVRRKPCSYYACKGLQGTEETACLEDFFGSDAVSSTDNVPGMAILLVQLIAFMLIVLLSEY